MVSELMVLLIIILTKMELICNKNCYQKSMKNNIINKDNGDSTGENTKSDGEISTKLPLAKYYLIPFSDMG